MNGDRLARGTVYAVAAQVCAAALGFALIIFLARHLGPTLFGRYGVIISFLAWAEFLVITGIPDAVARSIAAEGQQRESVFRTGLRLELILALLLFVAFYLSAPLFSSLLFQNPSLVGAFRLAALDIPFYALFSIHLGYIRGIRGFARQSWTIGFYAAARFLSASLLVLAGFSLEGALIGNALGSLAALLLVRLLVSRDLPRSPGPAVSAGPIIAYALPLVAGVLLYNALISVDLWMVERLAGNPEDVGVYTAVWNMARTPYFLFMGISVVLFPALSRLLASGDLERARRTVEQANRLFTIAAVPLVLLSGVTGSGLMGLAFSKAYLPDQSGPLLAVLIAGYALLSFSLISTAALTAAGRLALVFSINLFLLVAQIALTHWLVPLHGLAGAALSTLMTGAAGYLLAQVCLSRFLGAQITWPLALRVLGAAVPATLLASILPTDGWMLILSYASSGLIYLLGLFILGEITWTEVAGYGAQFRSRRSSRHDPS
jgi:stage V sporulation protein B